MVRRGAVKPMVAPTTQHPVRPCVSHWPYHAACQLLLYVELLSGHLSLWWTTFQRMGALGPARQKVADCRRIDLGIFFVRGRQCPGFAGAPDQHGVTDLDARSAVDGGVDRDVGDV